MAETNNRVVMTVTASAQQFKSVMDACEAQGIQVPASIANAWRKLQGPTMAQLSQFKAIGEAARNAGGKVTEAAAQASPALQTVTVTAKDLGRNLEDAGSRGARGIAQILGPLRAIRIAEYSTLGLISVGFYINEWQRVFKALQSIGTVADQTRIKLADLQATAAALPEGVTKQVLTLQDAIRKLEGKPAQNGLKLALLDAKSAADQLASSIEKDITSSQKLFDQGIFKSLFTGTESGSSIQKSFLHDRALIAEARLHLAQAQNTQKGIEEAQKNFAASIQKYLDDLKKYQTESLTAAKLPSNLFVASKYGVAPTYNMRRPLGPVEQMQLTSAIADAESMLAAAIEEEKVPGLIVKKAGLQGRVAGEKRADTFVKSWDKAFKHIYTLTDKLSDKQIVAHKKALDAISKEELSGKSRHYLPLLPSALYSGGMGNLLTLQEMVSGKYAISQKELDLHLKEMLRRARTHAESMQQFGGALRGYGTFAGENLGPLGQSYSQFMKNYRAAAQMAGEQQAPAISRLKFHFLQVKQATDQAGISMQSFSKAMGTNIAQAIVYGDNIGKAMEKAAKATIESYAAQALVAAIFETAVGFGDLAIGNLAGASQAFESAAIYGMVGGAAAAIGSAIPGGGRGGAGSYSRSSRGTVPGHGLGGSPGIAGGTGAFGSSGSGRFHQTNVYVYGTVTDTRNIQNLVTQLNQGGQSGTVRLNTSGTSTSIPAPIY